MNATAPRLSVCSPPRTRFPRPTGPTSFSPTHRRCRPRERRRAHRPRSRRHPALQACRPRRCRRPAECLRCRLARLDLIHCRRCRRHRRLEGWVAASMDRREWAGRQCHGLPCRHLAFTEDHPACDLASTEDRRDHQAIMVDRLVRPVTMAVRPATTVDHPVTTVVRPVTTARPVIMEVHQECRRRVGDRRRLTCTVGCTTEAVAAGDREGQCRRAGAHPGRRWATVRRCRLDLLSIGSK